MPQPRPSIFQMLVVGFAVLSVGFVGTATVVAVSTATDEPGPSRAALVELVPTEGTLKSWSTATVAERFGAARTRAAAIVH